MSRLELKNSLKVRIILLEVEITFKLVIFGLVKDAPFFRTIRETPHTLQSFWLEICPQRYSCWEFESKYFNHR